MTAVTTNQPLDTTAAAPPSSMWTTTRLVALLFTAVDVLLLARFAFKLFAADPDQSLVSAIYRITEQLVAPFRGIVATPAGPPVVEIDTVLAMVAYALIGALVAGVIHAFIGRREDTI